MTGSIDGERGNIWERLQRRKVVQWGIVYAAGAWGLLQGLAYVTATFHWPEQFQQLATIALLVGLPIVLVLAWYHGDRGEQRVTRVELAILTLLFLLGGGLFWRFQGSSEEPPATRSESATSARAAPTPGAGASIAVLPFENRSKVEDEAFFVDGIHDDILTQLSKISALKVISRTSVERFRDSDLSISQIAAQLGVKSILEGGVQRAGNRVRINVQLIDASTDAHLWAETYASDTQPSAATDVPTCVPDSSRISTHLSAWRWSVRTSTSPIRTPSCASHMWRDSSASRLAASQSSLDEEPHRRPGWSQALCDGRLQQQCRGVRHDRGGRTGGNLGD